MTLEILAMVQGKPARASIELSEVKWVFDAATEREPAINVPPDSIYRVNLVVGGRIVVKR